MINKLESIFLKVAIAMGTLAAISKVTDNEVAYKSGLARALIACGITGLSIGKRYISRMYNHQ